MNEPSLPEESLFAQVLELQTDAERAAFLDRTCGNNPALRAEVEALLRAHEQSGDLLDLPENLPVAAALPAREVPGTVIGLYKLLEQIGEGGMGTVWMAEQTEPIRRRVALKVVKEGMDSKQVLARFEAERQALALMEHPNIAKVLDAGRTPSGRPYFVMELVKGRPITQYCDDKRLGVRERLELFGDVCRAVQHAHQKGIIHRDLKPSNVLVAPYDGKPVVKVIDFGVAKATGQRLTDKTLFTGFGALIGTPEYMSPEQAEVNNQDIDTRSDVYSLGVLLYELLTGSTPLTHKRVKETALLEVLRVIREEEPPRPSTRLSESKDSLPSISAQRQTEPAKLTKLVRGELDWIVMKALDKDRNRRYETANGFAVDVQRYLADEPVQACPPSAWYQFRKFVRRKKRTLMVGGLILFFIAVLGGGSGWMVRDRAARQAKAANDLELTLDRAELFQREGRRAEALAALDRAELLASQTDPDLARDQRLAAVKERLDAETRDQEFIARFEAIRLLVSSRVDVERSIFTWDAAGPEIRDALHRYGIAITDMAPAQAIALVQSRPEPVRRNLVAALDEYLKFAPKEEAQTQQWLLAVLDGVDAADKDAWRVRVRKASADRENKALEQLIREVDETKQPPSFLLRVAGDLPAQMASTKLDLLRRTQRAYPSDLWANHELAFALSTNGKPAEAVRYYTAALALRPDNPGIYLNRGVALGNAGEMDAAIADYRQAVALAPKYAYARNNLGLVLKAKGQLDEAIAAFREAVLFKKDFAAAQNNLNSALQAKTIADCTQLLELNPNDVLALNKRGMVYKELGQYDKAIVDYSKVLDLDAKNAPAWLGRGFVYNRLSQYDKAIADCSKALELDPKLAEAWRARGNAHYGLGQYDKAIADISRAIELNPMDMVVWQDRGNAQCDLGQYEKAVADFSRALELKPNDVFTLCKRGDAYLYIHQYNKAIADFSKALKLNPKDTWAWRDRGNAHLGLGQYDKAVADISRALELNPKNAVAWGDRGNVYLSLRQYDKSIADSSKAIDLDPKLKSAWNNRAWVYKRLGQYDKAVADYSKVLDLDAKIAPAWVERGHTYNRLGQFDKAIADCTKAIALNPKLANAWRYRGVAYNRLGQYDKAVADLSKALELDPKEAYIWSNRGTAHYGLGRYDEAVTDCSKAIDLQPKEAFHWFARGNVFRGLGKHEEAVADYSTAIELDPKDWDSLFNRSISRSKLGQYDQAVVDASKAIELNPEHAGAHNHLAWLLANFPEEKRRDPKRAVELAKKAVQLAPNDSNNWGTLGTAQYRAGNWEAAVVAVHIALLEKSKGGNAYDWFILAMSQWKLGDPVQARKDYDQAVQWMKDNEATLAKDKNEAEQLRRFRNEAEEVLELKKM